MRDLLEWGVVAYPMRFEPLDSLKKNQHIGSKWTPEQLELVAHARRVIGYGGAFPPYEGLRKKFINAKSFEEAFSLRPPSDDRRNGDRSVKHLTATFLLASKQAVSSTS